MKAIVAGAKKSDFWRLNPDELVINENLRGRTTIPYDHIRDLAIQMYEETQLEPVGIRNVAGKYHLVFGYCRVDGVKLIRKGFEHEGTTYHDPNFLVSCIPSIMNDKKAFRRNVMENVSRLMCSAIDDANNQEIGRDHHGMSDVDLAHLYKTTVHQINERRRLLGLSDKHQIMVHEGQMSLALAYTLLDLPEKEREGALQLACQDGRLNTGVVKEILRGRQASGQAPNAKTSTARSLSEVRKAFETLALVDTSGGGAAKLIVAFINGKASIDDLTEGWESITGFSAIL